MNSFIFFHLFWLFTHNASNKSFYIRGSFSLWLNEEPFKIHTENLKNWDGGNLLRFFWFLISDFDVLENQFETLRLKLWRRHMKLLGSFSQKKPLRSRRDVTCHLGEQAELFKRLQWFVLCFGSQCDWGWSMWRNSFRGWSAHHYI